MEIRRRNSIVEVEYGPGEKLELAYQPQVKAALLEAGQAGPVGLLVYTPPDLRKVEVEVLSYWLGAFRDPAVRVQALAGLVHHRALRVLGEAFGRSLAVVGGTTRIRIFTDEAEARAWLAEAVAPPATPTPG